MNERFVHRDCLLAVASVRKRRSFSVPPSCPTSTSSSSSCSASSSPSSVVVSRSPDACRPDQLTIIRVIDQAWTEEQQAMASLTPTATLPRGHSSKQTPAQKRAARFATAQSKLTTEELTEQKRQNSTTSRRPIVVTTMHELQMARRWFTEFLQDQYPDVDVEDRYFTPNRPPPDMFLLKEYGRYLVRSRVGRITTRLSVNTMQHYMAMIVSILEAAAGHFPPRSLSGLRSELRNFVAGDLVQQEGISTAMHMKAVVHSEDLTFILSRLYSPTYLNTFPNMRTVFNLNVYICLVVDLCGRGSDIARHALRPEHMCLCWGDVAFYTFQRDDDDSFDIRAQVTVRWSKGQSHDDSAFRIIALPGLLPTTEAKQDTLRLLLVAKNGRRMATNKDMHATPVLRRMDIQHRLTKSPVQTGDMQKQIRRLGNFCGFEHRLIAYCMRRGVAYVLANQTNEENRKYLMGHKTGSKVFSAYHSKVSTIDFPAMFRSLSSRPVNAQYGMMLNQSSEAPAMLSRQGHDAVMQDEDVVATQMQMDVIRRKILEQHNSLAAAARTSEPLWDDYKAASEQRISLVQTLTRRLYAEEYEQHFAQLPTGKPAPLNSVQRRDDHSHQNDGGLDQLAATGGSNSDDHDHDHDHDDDDDDSGLFVSESQNDDERAIQSDADKTLHEAMELLDPQLRQSSGTGDESFPADFVESLIGDEPTTPPPPLEVYQDGNITQDDGDDTAQVQTLSASENTQSMRLHGLPPDVFGKGKNRVLLKGQSAYDDMNAELAGAEGDEAALCDTMLRWFNVAHPIDAFPLGEQPLPGTYDCHFCGKDLAKIHHAHEHTRACAEADATSRSKQLLQAACPPEQACQYQECGTGPAFKTFVDCGKTFSNSKDKGEHMRNHVRSMTKKNAHGSKVPTCFFGDCASNPEGGRLRRDGPDFDSPEDLLAHMWDEHCVSTLKTANATYCDYCHTWLLQPHEWYTHARVHLNDARTLVKEYGYGGMTAGRTIIPRLCPFCYHDDALPAHKRIFTFGRDAILKHLVVHLSELKNDGGCTICPCYPSMCTKVRDMDAVQMSAHLEDVHKLEVTRHWQGALQPLADVTNISQPARKARKTKKGDDAAAASKHVG
ncbi:hypothetical protein DOTSEDRAFT_32084 [Dothistroma septosporum NZE10]|uniref:Uncharacterized protein n=1 Tax=Dothistroma septosporum (strain NZE10 / CBS 128990) TaxID=675120 RepID=N1PZ96_DOTSN|nr:hypothetical protein DOTSEDRAFT_32084 [Dothistroma septosporum NZE10]